MEKTGLLQKEPGAKEPGPARTWRELGLKLTPQRLAILEYLDGNTAHPAAEEIFAALSGRFPGLSLATVYNTLAILRDRGRLLELTIDPSKRRYDPQVKPHHHLICLSCKRIADIEHTFALEIPGALRMGYEITGNQIEFYGLCPDCKKRAKRTGGGGHVHRP
ncbi:MAG: Fur family transcriptional regulator [Nitrospiraceae bacterium]|nr:Fur family transcriptional regulator [Nitrospiraceae bacterium]